MNYFESEQFQKILLRYEQSKRKGNFCYLDSDDFIDVSDYYFDRNLLHKALEAAERGVAIFPSDRTLQGVKAGVLISLHRFGEAERILRGLDPEDDTDVIYMRAQLEYAVNGDAEKADKLFHEWVECVEEELQEEEPDEEDDAEEEWGDAEEDLRRSYVCVVTSYTTLSDKDCQAYVQEWIGEYVARFENLGKYESDYVIADIAQEEGLPNLVETICRRLLDYDPYLTVAWARLALALFRKDECDEGLEAADFALAIEPENELALQAKAFCLYALNRMRDALSVFLQWRKRSGKAYCDSYIALCYAGMEDTGNALAYACSSNFYWEKQKEQTDEKAWALYDTARAFERCARLGEARRLVEECLTIIPDNPMFMVLKGYLSYMEHDEATFRACFDALPKLSEENPSRMMSVALGLFGWGYYDLAIDYFEFLLRHATDAYEERNQAYAYLAYAYFQTQNFDKACGYLKTACAKVPRSVREVFGDVLQQDVSSEDYYRRIVEAYHTD